MRLLNLLKHLIGIILGMIAGLFLNYFFLEKLIIPDPCYYHNNNDKGNTAFFDLFYSTPSWNGYHPWPTLLNLIITLLIGSLLGYWAGKRIRHTFTPKILP